jgi:hypothetical protein
MNKQTETTAGKNKMSKAAVKPVTLESTDLNHVLHKNGYFDGKLFHARDKATYTFIHDDEVITLHLDQTRKTLFFQGHKVTDLSLHPHLHEFIAVFKKLLTQNDQAHHLVSALDGALSTLC